MSDAQTRLDQGCKIIKAFTKTLPAIPGVYRMIGAKEKILYIGKARNLKARVTSYTRPQQLPIRLQRMIAETAHMEFTTTQSEAEALLLEAVLIKEHLPRYNIQLRDDKSFPYILITLDHAFPRVHKHRGAKTVKGDYFGPFLTAGGAVDQTIVSLQRAFLLRNCNDGFFAARKRPCLQYHIKRCSAPCVGYIDERNYAGLVSGAKKVLKGHSQDIQTELAEKMQKASQQRDYEGAAKLRDRIRALSLIQTRQRVHIDGMGDADIHAISQLQGKTCIQVFCYRSDAMLGNYAFFPKHSEEQTCPEILSAFLVQFYSDKPVPKLILVNEKPSEQELLERALSLKGGAKIKVSLPLRGRYKDAVDQAADNAKSALNRSLQQQAGQKEILQRLADALSMPQPPQRIEIYDNSHHAGKQAVGAMVVATDQGFQKKMYRKFSIRRDDAVPEFQAGDDYAMLEQVLRRRFAHLAPESQDSDRFPRPDLVIIDGGLGQMGIALKVLQEAGFGDIPLLAIAKGPMRNAGQEKLFLPDGKKLELKPNDPLMHYLQRLRDEAHRFAIGSHRKKSNKELGRSELEGVPGIGAVRKRALLHHFGSVGAIKRAGIADLQAVPGINRNIAEKIYAYFHS